MARNDIIVKLRLAGEQFDRDFKVKFQDLTAAAEASSASAGTNAGSAFGKNFALAAGAAGAGIGLAINSAAELGKEIASTSKQFNIGVESLQVWRKAASNAGVSADDLREGIAELTLKIGEAVGGNRQAQQAFADLGIGFETTAGQARATDAVMIDLARRIAGIEDPAERVRVGQQLLGDEFKNLHPLLLQGADGFNSAAAEIDRFGGALSAKEIQDLESTNRKIEDLKNQLSISVAKVVADNADSILGLANAIATLTGAMAKYVADYPRFSGLVGGALVGARFGGLPGAAVGGLGGLYVGQGIAREQTDADMDMKVRLRELQKAQQQLAASTRGTVDRSNDPVAKRAQAEVNRQTALYHAAWKASKGDQGQANRAELIAAPRISADGGSARPGGGGARPTGGAPRTPTQSAAEKEAERAAREAVRNEEQLRDAIARTLRAQQDSADIQRIRAEQGEEAAARTEAELGFLRQHPLAVNDTVEALAKALGITKELTDADRQRLQLLIDQGNAAQTATGDAAAAKVREEQAREAKKQEDARAEAAQREADRWAAEYERAIFDVANIYETAFRGGTDDLWRAFKDEGTRIIAEIAAQWTLAMVAGQPFNLASAATGALGRSPLSSIFFGPGGGRAANDNGGVPGFGGGIFGGPNVRRGSGTETPGFGDWVGANLPSGGAIPTTGGGFDAVLRGGGKSFLKDPTFALGLGALTSALVGGGRGSQMGGMVGSIGGQALGAKIGALGSFGGPVGAIAGALLGSLLPALLSSPKRASVTVGGAGGTLGITGRQGNSAARDQTATQGATSLIDSIFRIADQLGGSVDASRGSVSFGVRKNSFRVDPSGGGATKIGNGAVDFGSDQEAAMRFAISDLIRDGVIIGISQASQNLLQGSGDLETQIEKALLIEQIPKLLRQRTDPLGAALDELSEKFKKVNDALVEGSASAEQFAQARQLWELEKADAIASVGSAARTLTDFLAGLNAGSNSPLSLREQRAEAERQLAPFLTQISAAEAARAEAERLKTSGAGAAEIAAAEEKARTAASAIDQQGFTEASQLLLSISRQTNASASGFFSDFDRIRALTGQAISFVDQATSRQADARDPFGSAIAENTGYAASLLADLAAESVAQGETLQQIAAAARQGWSGADLARTLAEERARAAAALAPGQQGSVEVSQLLQSINRQSDVTAAAFSSGLDRISALAGQAIGLADQGAAQPTVSRDPLSSAIAQNTSDAVMMLAEERARAAAAIAPGEQGGVEASQLLQSINRQSDVSAAAFSSGLDRISALAGQAIGLADQGAAQPTVSRDPLSSAIAQNTGDAAMMLAEQTRLLQRILAAVNDNSAFGASGGGGGSSFVTEPRAFAN